MDTKTALHVEIINPGSLTKTEAKILTFICMGWLKPKIAEFLHRSYKTIDTHDDHIKQKLQAHSNSEVVATAVADGMVKITRASKALVVFLALLVPIMTIINPDCARASRTRLRLPRQAATRLK